MATMSRLLRPLEGLWDWQLRGACRNEDPVLFFHRDGERGPERRQREAHAKVICSGCPVIRECAEHALAAREPYGVWGGMTEDDRQAGYVGAESRRRRLTR